VRRTVTAAVSSRSPGSDRRPARSPQQQSPPRARCAGPRRGRRPRCRPRLPSRRGCVRAVRCRCAGSGRAGEVHHVARDPRPEPHRRRPAAGEQPGGGGELAQPHGSRRAARVGVAGGAHGAGDVLRRRDRGSPSARLTSPRPRARPVGPPAPEEVRSSVGRVVLMARLPRRRTGAAPVSAGSGDGSRGAPAARWPGASCCSACPVAAGRTVRNGLPRPGKTRRDRGVALREHAPPDRLP
jgi:hypothetical protein